MIVYCSQDLIFTTKISGTADALKIPARPARDEKMLANRLNRVDDGRVNEPVTGVLIDLEMGEEGLALLEQVKKHDARIPVIAYGSHVAVDVLQAAKERGADFVMPRGMFSAQLPQILERFGGTKE
jgi:DNA-binding NtrC family response regulator